jgi:hypothetical protein
MNSVIELNNKAVLCLQAQDASEACNLLTIASGVCLKATGGQSRQRKHQLDLIISWINFSNSGMRKGDESRDHPTLYNFTPAIKKPCCAAGQGLSSSSKSCSTCRNDSNVCPCSISPVIWYNLAISCQLLGVKFGSKTKDGDFYLTRSQYLYEKVLTLCSHVRSKQSGSLSNLRLAVLNNLACVHHEMGRENDCLRVMRALKESLFTVSRRRPRRCVRSWRIFQVNLLMIGPTRPAAAA